MLLPETVLQRIHGLSLHDRHRRAERIPAGAVYTVQERAVQAIKGTVLTKGSETTMKTLMRGVSVWLMLLWIFYPLRGYETDAFTLWEAAVRFLALGLLFGASALVTYILPEKGGKKKDEPIVGVRKKSDSKISDF